MSLKDRITNAKNNSEYKTDEKDFSEFSISALKILDLIRTVETPEKLGLIVKEIAIFLENFATENISVTVSGDLDCGKKALLGCLLSGVIGLLGVVLILGSIPWFVMPFESHIKSLIMPILLKNIPLFKWSSLNITSLGYKICKLIRASKLVGRFNEVNADECFQGVYKNVAIDINELKLNLVGIGLPFPVVKFNGVIVKLIPPRKYKGLTLIKKKKIINMSPKALKYVNLEDLEFEKDYNVYSNDQIEARYVLTTAFMERFKNIKLAFKASKIEASISEQGILIAISTNRDLFKVGKLWRPVADYEQFKTMADEFASILELIDTLKLEQNIGM